VIIKPPVGWIGEQHTSPRPQVLFCLARSIKITCSTGEVAVIDAGMGIAMSDVSGKRHKSEVTSSEPASAVIIQQ
jgi:hypothetical protein